MANRLGMGVVAEGVEKEEQLLFLQNRGCDEIQGYYYHRPMSEARLIEILWQTVENTKIDAGAATDCAV
jgi:EAL domain-containing protein (putative c-di-GMP-specific phosphodiesterase class I)